ncbi:MAG: hypothetical protein F4145_01960 [Boseongicola sp. SB0675_bin_26]|nr:hypothetical protein [Boseongicola sp. SB0675_bin_26]
MTTLVIVELLLVCQRAAASPAVSRAHYAGAEKIQRANRHPLRTSVMSQLP